MASDPRATVVVASIDSDVAMEATARSLTRAGWAIIIINEIDGAGSLCHPEVPTLTAPVATADVVDLIEHLTGLTLRPAEPFEVGWAIPRPVLPPPPPPPADPRPPVGWETLAAPPAADFVVPAWDPPTTRRRAGTPQVLVFTCPKGGSGKTSLSLAYAAFLGAALRPVNKTVVWVDGNLQQADGARYLRADERSSSSIVDLVDIVGRGELDDRAVLGAVTAPEGTGQPIWALFGPTFKSEADPRIFTPALYREVVGLLRRHFDYVVVDTPVAEYYEGFFRDFAIPESDQLIVVFPPLLPVVRGVREWLELQSHPVAAGGAALPAAKVRLVLNMASAHSGCPSETVRDAWLTRWTWAGEVPYDRAWTAATNNGSLMADSPAMAGRFAELVRSTTGEIVGPGRPLGRSPRGGGDRGGAWRRLWASLRGVGAQGC